MMLTLFILKSVNNSNLTFVSCFVLYDGVMY